MPIDSLLRASDFTPEQRYVARLAFDYALRKLGLVDRDDPVCDIVARKILDLCSEGATVAVVVGELAHRLLTT